MTVELFSIQRAIDELALSIRAQYLSLCSN
jgi:hypothetical protein